MSYNDSPKWANVHYVIYCPCPKCGVDNTQQFDNELEAMMEGSYYEAPHIPKTVWLTCIDCEFEFTIELAVTIHKTKSLEAVYIR